MFGYVMEGEIKAIDKVLGNPQRPLTVILGGAKVSSKIGVIEHLLDLADNMIVCGGMAFTFMKAQGGSIGKSLVEDDQIQTALDTLAKAKEKGVRLYFSDTVVAADAFDNNARTQICPANAIPDGWMGCLSPGPSSGTVPPEYSRCPISHTAPTPSPRSLPRPPQKAHSLSWAAVTPWLP